MNRRVTTALIFTLIVLAFLLPGSVLPWLPVIFFALISLIASIELQQALVRTNDGAGLIPSMIGSLLCLAPVTVWVLYRDLRPGWAFLNAEDAVLDEMWRTDMIWLLSLGAAFFALCLLLFLFTIMIGTTLLRGPGAISGAAASSMSSWYIAAPFSAVPLFMYAIPNGWRWLLIGVFSAWISDVLCYYFGKGLGHTQILPRISPNKTLEGTIGGLVGSALIGGLFFMFFMREAAPVARGWGASFAFGAVAGLLLSAVEQLGDWMASAIKRQAHIKDFSRILPGHGGILDRFDGVLLTLPATLILCVVYLVF